MSELFNLRATVTQVREAAAALYAAQAAAVAGDGSWATVDAARDAWERATGPATILALCEAAEAQARTPKPKKGRIHE